MRVNDESGTFLDSSIEAGDLFRVNFGTDAWGDESYDEYLVAEVVSNEELLLTRGPSVPIVPARKYEIWKDNTAANVMDNVVAQSTTMSHRRVSNVWSDAGKYFNGNAYYAVSNVYVAAEMAGLRTAVLPQQGLTRTEVTTIASAANMYTKFTQDQLDTIAANGTWVVTQEYEDGPVFIRHQLTTKSDSGSLYYEDSVGVNLDDISFSVDAILDGFIGRRNANPETVREIYQKLLTLLISKTENPTGVELGPQLIDFENLRVQLNETLKDQVDVYAKLILPLPLNKIVVTLHGTVTNDTFAISFGDVGVDAQITQV